MIRLPYARKARLLLIGHGRHGKDSAAEILNQKYKMSFTSSSMTAARIFIFEEMKDRYESPEECYKDRSNHRKEWFDMICEYNEEDPAHLAKKILESNDIYVGMRSRREFEASHDLFDHIVWIDASKRHPKEPTMELTAKDADIFIDNNGNLADLEHNIDNMMWLMKSE